jgi:hypothetical protein
MLCTKTAARSAMLQEWQDEIRRKSLVAACHVSGVFSGDESADALANIRKAIGAAFLSELNAKALGSLADELDAAAKGFRRLGAASELKRATEGLSSR